MSGDKSGHAFVAGSLFLAGDAGPAPRSLIPIPSQKGSLTLNPKPETLNPKPETLNPKP